MAIYFVYLLLYCVGFISAAARLLVSLFALDLGARPLTVGLLAGTVSVFPMLLAVTVGTVADRFGARWLVLFSTFTLAIGMAVPYFNSGISGLFIAAAFNGVSFAAFSVSLQNLVGIMSEPSVRARNYSNFSLIISLLNFSAPLFVGFSIDHVGHVKTSLWLALFALVPMVMLFIWGGALPGGNQHAARKKGSVLETLRAPGVWRVLLASSLIISGQDLFLFYMPVYGHSLGLSASAIGFILGACSAAGFVSRLAMTPLLAKFSAQVVLAYSFYLAAAGFLLIPFCSSPTMLILLAFVFGLGISCGQPIVTSLTFESSRAGRTGEALGIKLTVNHLTRVVGPLIFGAIGSALGLFPVFWGNALMLVGGGVLSRRRTRE